MRDNLHFRMMKIHTRRLRIHRLQHNNNMGRVKQKNTHHISFVRCKTSECERRSIQANTTWGVKKTVTPASSSTNFIFISISSSSNYSGFAWHNDPVFITSSRIRLIHSNDIRCCFNFGSKVVRTCSKPMVWPLSLQSSSAQTSPVHPIETHQRTRSLRSRKYLIFF